MPRKTEKHKKRNICFFQIWVIMIWLFWFFLNFIFIPQNCAKFTEFSTSQLSAHIYCPTSVYEFSYTNLSRKVCLWSKWNIQTWQHRQLFAIFCIGVYVPRQNTRIKCSNKSGILNQVKRATQAKATRSIYKWIQKTERKIRALAHNNKCNKNNDKNNAWDRNWMKLIIILLGTKQLNWIRKMFIDENRNG